MKENLTNRQIQAKKTHDKVFKTAINLMHSKGFENITVSEICKKAGVSTGTFYNCFESKYNILDEIFKDADFYFLSVVSTSLKSLPFNKKIQMFFKYYAEYNDNQGVAFTKHLYYSRSTLFIKKDRPMQNVLQDIIEEGQNLSKITNKFTSLEIVEYLFISVRGLLYDWCLHEGEYNLIQAMDKYVEILLVPFYTIN